MRERGPVPAPDLAPRVGRGVQQVEAVVGRHVLRARPRPARTSRTRPPREGRTPSALGQPGAVEQGRHRWPAPDRRPARYPRPPVAPTDEPGPVLRRRVPGTPEELVADRSEQHRPARPRGQVEGAQCTRAARLRGDDVRLPHRGGPDEGWTGRGGRPAGGVCSATGWPARHFHAPLMRLVDGLHVTSVVTTRPRTRRLPPARTTTTSVLADLGDVWATRRRLRPRRHRHSEPRPPAPGTGRRSVGLPVVVDKPLVPYVRRGDRPSRRVAGRAAPRCSRTVAGTATSSR